jgi:hypothetical protein
MPAARREHAGITLGWRFHGTFAGMGLSRLFVSQSKLDEWLTETRVEVEGDVMTTKPEGRMFELKTAVLFVEEVTGTADAHELVGKVKDLGQITELGGEYASGSVILGDNAYTVVEGFVGEAVALRPSLGGDTLAAAMRSAAGDDERSQSGELDLLSRFLLQSRSQ